VTDKRFLMKLLGGKYAGIWLMGKNHKTCEKQIVFLKLLCQEKAFEDKMNCQFQKVN
jgi:hypothetical protein